MEDGRRRKTERRSQRSLILESFRLKDEDDIRVGDFLSTKSCICVRQHHFGGKT